MTTLLQYFDLKRIHKTLRNLWMGENYSKPALWAD